MFYVQLINQLPVFQNLRIEAMPNEHDRNILWITKRA